MLGRRFELIAAALAWARDDDSLAGEDAFRVLSLSAGRARRDAGEYPEASGHLVYGGDADELHSLLRCWHASQMYPAEWGLLVLRTSLALLVPQHGRM